jgi:hypothetical protein
MSFLPILDECCFSITEDGEECNFYLINKGSDEEEQYSTKAFCGQEI